MVPKPTRKGTKTGQKTRRSCDEGEGRPRVAPARAVAPRHDAASPADDERHDAPSPLPPGRAAGRARAAGARRAARAAAVTSPPALLWPQ